MVTESSICYIIRGGKVLLQLKGIGTEYVGKWIAPGGAILDDDSPKESVIRETKEQTGIELSGPHLIGRVICLVDNKVDKLIYVFRADESSGEANSTGGITQWFERGKLPKGSLFYFDELWADRAFENKPFTCKLYFNKGYVALLKSEVA